MDKLNLLLDSASIARPSLLHGRAPQAFTDPAFSALKRSIAHLGVNVQPIKVRPAAAGVHELVFGARRLQACLELGLPVAAVVQPTTGPQAVIELDASNDDGHVSIYERGCLYESALAAGIFPSRRRLAEGLGRPLLDVANACTVAQLPQPLLGLMRDPRVISLAAAKRLTKAMAADPAGFEARLNACQARARSWSTGLTLKSLLETMLPSQP